MTGSSRDNRGIARPRATLARGRGPATRGATLFAVSVGVFILGVALSIAVPVIQSVNRRTQATAVVEDLRDFARTFHTVRERGDWPAATSAPGHFPIGMESVLDSIWSHHTPIGGGYLWAPDALQRGRRYRATIMLCGVPGSPVANDPKLLREIDRQIDDGDLHSGKFQSGYRDQPFFVLEP